MKILTVPILGVLSLALAGCIGKDDGYDHDHADHHQSSSIISTESSIALSSSSEVAISSSSMPSISSMSSAISIPSVSSMSSTVSSSSTVVSSSVASSSSVPAINIEDLRFSAVLNSDQSIQTDSIENLGSALIGLIDEQAYNEFYLGLIAQGLDQAAIAKAVSALGPVGMAIAADFIKAFSGQALLPAPEGINLVSTVTAVGGRGVEYAYTVNQTINEVDVALKLALRFEAQAPTLTALIGRTGYKVFLDGLKLIVDELSLTTTDVVISLDTANPMVASSGGLLDAQVELTADGSGITAVTFNGESLALNLKGTVVNGMVGVTANGSGTIGVLKASLDMVSGSSTIDVTQPDVKIDMQGLDTSN